jgi:hypothetical protein
MAPVLAVTLQMGTIYTMVAALPVVEMPPIFYYTPTYQQAAVSHAQATVSPVLAPLLVSPVSMHLIFSTRTLSHVSWYAHHLVIHHLIVAVSLYALPVLIPTVSLATLLPTLPALFATISLPSQMQFVPVLVQASPTTSLTLNASRVILPATLAFRQLP